MNESKEIVKKEVAVVDVKTIQDFLFSTDTKLSEKQQKLFLQLAIRNQLDPFKREIYAIPYGKDFSIVTGYQVYIQKAEATGLLNGWYCEAIKDEKGLLGAKITIYRKDFEKPFEWEVSFKEFYKDQSNWKKMPEFMIKKVCIGQGFRLAFPNELAGLPYLQEEVEADISREETPQEVSQEEVKKELATEKQVKAIHSIISSKKLDEEEIKQNLGIEHFSNLTKEQASDLISDLDKLDKEVKGEE